MGIVNRPIVGSNETQGPAVDETLNIGQGKGETTQQQLKVSILGTGGGGAVRLRLGHVGGNQNQGEAENGHANGNACMPRWARVIGTRPGKSGETSCVGSRGPTRVPGNQVPLFAHAIRGDT